MRLPFSGKDVDRQGPGLTTPEKIRSEEILIIILCLLVFITATILSTWHVIVVRRRDEIFSLHYVCLIVVAIANLVFFVVTLYFAIIYFLFSNQIALFNLILTQFVAIYLFLGLVICRIAFEIMAN